MTRGQFQALQFHRHFSSIAPDIGIYLTDNIFVLCQEDRPLNSPKILEERNSSCKRHHQPCPCIILPHNRPALTFLSFFTSVTDFRDRLRLCAGLDKYDYTGLRMSCNTTTEGSRPLAIDPTCEVGPSADYFSGLESTQCTGPDCVKTSRTTPIRECQGKYDPTIMCRQLACLHCVQKSQRYFDEDCTNAREIHYCWPCSRREKKKGVGLCHCGIQSKDDVFKQDPSQWKCVSCQAIQARRRHVKAHGNLERLEEEGKVKPRGKRWGKDTFKLQRWIDEDSENRNLCPGCGRHYWSLLRSFGRGQREHHGASPDSRMYKQCMACLGRRL